MMWLLVACSTAMEPWWDVPTGYTPLPDTALQDSGELDTGPLEDQHNLLGSLEQSNNGVDVVLRYLSVENTITRCDAQYNSDKVRQIEGCDACLVALSIVHSNLNVVTEEDGTCTTLGWDAFDGVTLYVGMDSAQRAYTCTTDCDTGKGTWTVVGEALPSDQGFEFTIDL